ncbi:MAG: hypothetical protein ABSG22_02635 [Sedimentisphaerales bacterium]|jgi:hypothetical protein
MKRAYIKIICCLLGVFCNSAEATSIEYGLDNLGGSRYEYEYKITNDTLAMQIKEFTIWFDVDLYDNLDITTQQPLKGNWNEIILQDTGFGVPIGYDGLAQNVGILSTETLSGFSVSFDWLGTGTPNSQFFEIIDPVTFRTIDSGFTKPIPEPAALMLISLGYLLSRRRT